MLPWTTRRAKAAATRPRKAAELEPAEVDPVARVLVDVALAHLDRPFDYAVPRAMADTAVPGARVKVRFAGQDVDGFVVERAADHRPHRPLQPLRRVVSAEPVLSPEVAELTAAVAERYAGARSDVLRLAVPPRHATGGGRPSEPAPAPTAPRRRADAWAHVAHAEAFLRAPRRRVGRPARCGRPRPATTGRRCWPRRSPRPAPAAAARSCASPTSATSTASTPRSTRRSARTTTSCLTADGGPAARYRDFLAVSRGARRVVVGTRSAAFAPVHDLGLVVRLGRRRRPPRRAARALPPHPRGARPAGRGSRAPRCCSAAWPARPRPQQLAATRGWAHELAVPRAVLRDRARVDVGAGRGPGGRHPRSRGRPTTRSAHGLAAGPVLVQTPRAGYAASLACDPCRTPARCTVCTGPLVLPRPHRRRPRAAGAARPTRAGRAASAATAACARRCAARHARPRSSAGCSPAPPCAARAATGCWRAVSARRRHRGRDRRRRARRGGRLRRRRAARHLADPGARRHARPGDPHGASKSISRSIPENMSKHCC